MLSTIVGFAVLTLLLVSQVRSINIVNRDKWSTRILPSNVNNLPVPVSRVIIAHTDSAECYSLQTCTASVQSIQNYHVNDLGFSDIGYNFLVGGDGTVFEGRGWTTIGAHTLGYNKNSICVAFIGNFNAKTPTAKQLKAAELLLEEGVTDNLLTRDYRLFGHRQLIAINSPGNILYSIIKKWPHWSNSY